MQNSEFYIFDNSEQVVASLVSDFITLSKLTKKVHISLSGGSTPKKLFIKLAQAEIASQINWNNLHFWWGDERCVSSDSTESNFGEAWRLLFSKVKIDKANLHFIDGSNDIELELAKFSQAMQSEIDIKNGCPQFDWIILGMGADGHTASLFPNLTDYTTQNLAVIATQPQSGQKRISKSAFLLCNAARITYLVLGASKAKVISEIRTLNKEVLNYPAAHIGATNGKTQWYLDKLAANIE